MYKWSKVHSHVKVLKPFRKEEDRIERFCTAESDEWVVLSYDVFRVSLNGDV
jgi:hypothetical protein